jgi:hypothetical protein
MTVTEMMFAMDKYQKERKAYTNYQHCLGLKESEDFLLDSDSSVVIKSSDCYLIYELTTCRCSKTVLASFVSSFKLIFTYGALACAQAGLLLFSD